MLALDCHLCACTCYGEVCLPIMKASSSVSDCSWSMTQVYHKCPSTLSAYCETTAATVRVHRLMTATETGSHSPHAASCNHLASYCTAIACMLASDTDLLVVCRLWYPCCEDRSAYGRAGVSHKADSYASIAPWRPCEQSWECLGNVMISSSLFARAASM